METYRANILEPLLGIAAFHGNSYTTEVVIYQKHLLVGLSTIGYEKPKSFSFICSKMFGIMAELWQSKLTISMKELRPTLGGNLRNKYDFRNGFSFSG